jgi:membrane protease YdiL (CAAX protease family)
MDEAGKTSTEFKNEPVNGRPSPATQLFEVLVFLFLIVPSMAISFFTDAQTGLHFSVLAMAIILRDLSLLSLIVFFLWRNNEKFSEVGWTVHNVWREIGIGLLLYIPFYFLTSLLDLYFQQAGLSSPEKLPPYMSATTTTDYVLAFIMVVVVAISEETIFRGYLLLRFRFLTNNVVTAILISTFVFAIGHGYEGSAGVATVASMGIIFAAVYLWRGSLIAPIMMHFLQDFLSVVILPLSGLR